MYILKKSFAHYSIGLFVLLLSDNILRWYICLPVKIKEGSEFAIWLRKLNLGLYMNPGMGLGRVAWGGWWEGASKGTEVSFLLVPGRAPSSFVLLSLIALWPTGGPLWMLSSSQPFGWNSVFLFWGLQDQVGLWWCRAGRAESWWPEGLLQAPKAWRHVYLWMGKFLPKLLLL